jgi:hypothetical protein
MSNLKLFHKTDIALELIDKRSKIEKSFDLHRGEEAFIPNCAYGRVSIIHPELSQSMQLNVGDEVYFDPRFLVEIEELKLVIIDKKAVLLKA